MTVRALARSDSTTGSIARKAACGAALSIAASLALPAEAPAGCAAAVVVDGVVLLGTELREHGGRLPARGPRVRAIEPACNDTEDADEEDREITVTRLRGVPPHVAVDGGGNAVYAANGTLVELADHPLHRAFYADEGTPSLRRRGTCRPGGTLRGTAIRPPSSTFLRIATRTGERMIRFDAATRMGNRPAYEPVAEGQRLAVRTSRCGAHRVAERISFIGPTVALERLDPEDGGDLPIVYIVFGAILLISVPAILRITR